MRRGVPTPDYAELAVAAVGQNFALLAHACSMTELLTYNCMNLIALGKGVVSVFPMLSMETAMCLCIAISIGLSAVPDRHFAYIALIAALAILAAEGTCVLGGLELPEWAPCLVLVIGTERQRQRERARCTSVIHPPCFAIGDSIGAITKKHHHENHKKSRKKRDAHGLWTAVNSSFLAFKHVRSS